MNLKTSYLGLEISNPIVPGASPYSQNVDMVRLLEDAGAPAIVMHSLFEEQVSSEPVTASPSGKWLRGGSSTDTAYVPKAKDFVFSPDRYLEQIRRIKEAVRIPVIASLNAAHPGSWVQFASLMEQAGADALELNVYTVPAWLNVDSASIERELIDAVRMVKASLTIPIAVKITPFYTSLPHLAAELGKSGVEGLVLFNRFYSADIDVEGLGAEPILQLSTPVELGLRLRWTAILAGKVPSELIVSGGIHDVRDVVKAIMCGASAVQTVSALLKDGPDHLSKLVRELGEFMDEQDYPDLAALRGVLSLNACPNPSAYERSNYLRTLQLWRA